MCRRVGSLECSEGIDRGGDGEEARKVLLIGREAQTAQEERERPHSGSTTLTETILTPTLRCSGENGHQIII